MTNIKWYKECSLNGSRQKLSFLTNSECQLCENINQGIPWANAMPVSFKRQCFQCMSMQALLRTLIKFLLRPPLTTSSIRFFEHVQNSSTSSTLMETIPRPCRFALRSLYDVQVLTASTQFFEDAVGTWLSVTGPLLRLLLLLQIIIK